MIPSLLITFREVIEASLIVATILGILYKLKQTKGIRTVWLATASAALVSIGLLTIGSLAGIEVREMWEENETFIEGELMIVSAAFISWAVFFLHKYFAQYKTKLLTKIKKTVENEEQKGLFVLVFTAVFREGFEIALFLSTVYLSDSPQNILGGFAAGLVLALAVSFGLFKSTLKLPVYKAFRVTSILLILFAAGLLGRGINEFNELGMLPELGKLTMAFIPSSTSFAGEIIKAVFGITEEMHGLQLAAYILYTIGMGWYVFGRKKGKVPS